MAGLFYFLVLPAVYGGLVYLEYSVYSWDRFCARAAGEGFNVTNHLAPTLAPTKPPKIAAAEDVPTTAPLTRKEIAGDFLKDHPLAWILPLTGVAHGLLTNMVPISGSLILMPLFQELEVTKSSAATLVLCSLIQSVSNGLLGWFIWMCRDPRLLVCRALFLLVPFAWLGYVVGVTDNLSFKDLLLDVNEEIDDIGTREEIDKADIALLHTYLRVGLGVFMLLMLFFVLIGACIGGMNRYCCPTRSGGSHKGCYSFCQWLICMYCSFSTGYLFVANIGSGMACTTYFILSLFLGVETKRAMPTAVVIGGWTAWLPAVANYMLLESTPYIRFLMVFPGLWFGAMFSPAFSRCGGPICDIVWYFLLLVTVGTATVCWAAIAIQNGEEDIDINIKPMVSISAIDALFGDTPAPTVSPKGGGRGKLL